ncbi:hypothetical protein [Geodermatophilus obscurus]|uniref:Uncharacterized protein n=1 Tax=Geodermatophilus obscurus (strain ATCC 25078 / DSM 43160 / JCM 3152 / CCUG 61914 / KCC A-0152 / KCTC 9177 / NBRC 13315 / NRRL B-3577 / G-20) TaxID=526225 RepID=D2S5H7_GEOOG|nr:hypothetical protein [Geodermatophilus obscurus]ADB75257.1 hypothetical protein Gobs_2615 [Geodermatophilus obscurus DSM 43160]
MSVLDVLVSVSLAFVGALLGVFFTRGYGRWTRAAAARDKARDELDEIMRLRWWRTPFTYGNGDNRAAAQHYDERLPSYLRAAGVSEELISRLRDELDAFRWHAQADDDEASRLEKMDLDRLDEVADDIHIWLDEADRRHRESYPVSMGSRGTKGNQKSLMGIPA